jgi:hypothetical protein
VEPKSEGRGQTIFAYILLGILLSLYPGLLGYRAIVAWIGPEVVIYQDCEFTVQKLNSYSDTLTIKPKDEACVLEYQKAHADDLSDLSYKQLVKELRKRGRPNQ